MIKKNYENRNADQFDIEVEHKYIDFQPLILGEKIRSRKKYVLDEFKLAQLLRINEGNEEFYKQEYIKKIIDIQFSVTYKFYLGLFIFYLVFFFMPFVLSILGGCNLDETSLTTLYSFCCISQIVFVMVELLQLRYLGFAYFKEFFNIFELTQFLLFMYYLSEKLPFDH